MGYPLAFLHNNDLAERCADGRATERNRDKPGGGGGKRENNLQPFSKSYQSLAHF